MFASPTPSVARARRTGQPNARQSQPPRRTSTAIRTGTSRLNTPALRASVGPGHGSVAEDQDMMSEASYGTVTAAEVAGMPTYVKTPELTVTLSGHFPEEVRRILGSSGSYPWEWREHYQLIALQKATEMRRRVGSTSLLATRFWSLKRPVLFGTQPRQETSLAFLISPLNNVYREAMALQLVISFQHPAKSMILHIHSYPMCR
jgi:hypothetical protein